MRVYLAASWSRKDKIKKIADELIAMGVNVQSRWLDEPTFLPTDYAKKKFLQERAEIDVDDIINADVLVRFTDNLSAETVPSHLATGSRMFEMGLAYAYGALIVVVGGYQCVFDYLENINHVPDAAHLKLFLASYIGGER